MSLLYKSTVGLSLALVLSLGGLAASAPAVAGDGCCRGADANGQSVAEKLNIVETAKSVGTFKTLLAALEAAGLAETLAGKGPFTVFAPTDEAFAKLPKGTVEALLKDLPKLKAILTYHVVAGEVKAADVVKLTSAKTLNGRSVAIDAKDGVKIDGAKVVKADVLTSNGVIHVIDTVLIPAEPTPM